MIGVGDFKFTKRAKSYINDIMRTGRLSYGPYSRLFESLFAKIHQVKHAVFMNSGTSALQVALQALKEKYKWNDGDEVLVPAVTFVATANIVLHNRMKPVFVDVGSDYNINVNQIEKKITKRTRAIISVHLMGLPCDMMAIQEIAKKRKLKIIEDCCQAMFANYQKYPVGTWGDIGCFSTYIAHYVTTGVGGIAVTQNDDLALRMRSLMNHGRDPAYLSIDDKPDEVRKRFTFTSMGHSFRATEMEAAIGLDQLQDYESIVARRRKIALRYIRELQMIEQLQLPLDLFNSLSWNHVFMLFPISVKEKKDKLVNFLEKNGIETRDLCPLINQPIYRKLYGNLDKEYPVASWLNDHAFYIGCHQYITEKQQEYVIDKFYEFFRVKRS